MSAERRLYWRAEIDKAAGVVDRWYSENQSLWTYEDSAGLAARNAEKFLQCAMELLKRADLDADVGDASMREYIAGAYLQVKTPAPSWKEPLRKTADDLKTLAKDTAKDVATYGSAGAGFAVVIIAALWWFSRKATS